MKKKLLARKPAGRYHHGDLRAALVRAGLEIVRKDGIEGLTLRAVAQLIGVSRGAPYAHFADKVALVAAIRAEAHRQFGELMQQQSASNSEGFEPLYAMGRAYVRLACEEPALFHLITGPEALIQSGLPQTAPAYVEGVTALFNIIAAAVGEEPSSRRTLVTALAGLAMTRGIAQMVVAGDISPAMLGVKDRDALVTLLCKFFRPPESLD